MDTIKPTMENIKELVTHFANSGLGSFTMQDGAFSLRLESDAAAAAHGAQVPAQQAPERASVSVPQNAPEESRCTTPCKPEGTVVTSPVVGTFYSSASPDKPPFVKAGQQVKKGDVLFIIESMKLMNEIQSECAGVVDEILAQDGQMVEYGQPLLTLL
ncbi:MAG: acetyl-CoA carboxylase biotin carboxyl carrier protein [Acetanaerobacterium sp.]